MTDSPDAMGQLRREAQIKRSTLASVLQSTTDNRDCVAVSPAASSLIQIIDILKQESEQHHVSILGTQEYFTRTVQANPYLAFGIVELNNRGRIECFSNSTIHTGQHLLSPTETASVIMPGEVLHLTEKPAASKRFFSAAVSCLSEADAWIPTGPSLGTVKRSFAETLGDDAKAELVDILKHVPYRGGKTDVELRNAVLLLAARHNCFFYDVTQWGDTTNIAVKSTFSRRLETLVDAGIIVTQKERVGVGRPRIQLTLADQTMSNKSLEECITWAAKQLPDE